MPTTIQVSNNVKSILDRMKMMKRESYGMHIMDCHQKDPLSFVTLKMAGMKLLLRIC